MFERYTDRARRATVLAQAEARELGHPEISTGHLLLGLATEDGGVASQVLANLGLSVPGARGVLSLDPAAPSAAGHIPFTRGLKLACEQALRESLHLGHNYIATEHLLLGLLRDTEGDPAARIFMTAGITPTDIRAEVMRLLGSYEKSAAPRVSYERAPALAESLAAIADHLGRIEKHLGIADA